MKLTAAAAAALNDVLASRRAQARMRAVITVVIGLSFGHMVGWGFAVAWVAVYLALQRGEFVLLSRDAPSPYVGLALLSINSFVFGLMAAAGPLVDGAWGLACGVGLLCGGLLNSALVSQRSGLAFAASMWPFAAYLAAAPLAAVQLGADTHNVLGLAATGALIVVMSSFIWRSAANALEAESAARARAEAADAAKSAFVAMVSHELRTPISAILAGASEAGRVRGESDPNLGMILSAGRMMRALLDDLLDLSKIEAGKMGVETLGFDLRALVLETVRFWAPEARRRGVAFRLEGAHALPRWVSGDPTRIRQVLNNLLSNALKFTEAGAVTLRIEVAGDEVRLAVVDTGPGMDDGQLSRLFQAYGQASDSVARTHGGTGLGLAISRELARLMGGEISVVSRPGQGSAFTLAVPLPTAAPPEAEATGDEAVELALRCLVVDDHEVNRRAFALILEGAGVDVALAEDGEAALEALAAQPFDLVLMDLNMPRLGGLDAVRRLRDAPGPNRGVPVIALTASVSPSEVDACLAAGMNAFVMKPVEAAELFAAIERVLDVAPADDAGRISAA